jgi:FOG: PKD repeat
LTVTDSNNLTGSTTQQVTIAANQPPVASFTASISASAVSVNGGASTDPDGTIQSYDWNWGDKTPDGSGVTAQHTYVSAGTYTVTLTVTDNNNLTGTSTQQVAAAQAGAVPRPDHVVVVVEENHSESDIIGDTTDAPYINNTLVPEGALMTNSFAVTHPSQPNYLALFSGSTQGVTDDTCPVGPFATDNLAHQLQSNGQTFTAYSEGLPSVDSTACTSGEYARKHAPWTDFSNVAAGSSQPFSSFPTDYTQLPAVSFVVPNLMDDMHDGTIAQGDSWLQSNLDGYVQWARTHNSLLVVTWDEDDNTESNQIPTIIVGQHALAGQYSEQINHYNVLRTIEEAYGLPSVGSATQAAPITDIWGAGNQGPTAAFTDTTNGLTVNFDGTGSTDPDGTIQSYDWNWGDNTAHGNGATPQHTYAAAGTYTVTLTVTDSNNLTSQVTHNVTVTSGAVVYASDAFGRTVSNGWGNADVGGAWTRVGTASNFSVTNGTGNILMAKAGSGPSTYLNSVSSTNTDVQVGFTTDKAPTGTGIYVSVTGRHTASGDYRATVRLNGTQVQLQLVRVDQNGQANLTPLQTISGLTYTPGMVLQVRVDVTGTSPTTVQAQVWAAGTTEPAAWQVTATDSSAALQTAGSVGLMSYLAGSATNAPVTTMFDNFAAYEADTVPQPAAKPLAMAAMTTTHKSTTPPENQRVSPAFGKSSG